MAGAFCAIACSDDEKEEPNRFDAAPQEQEDAAVAGTSCQSCPEVGQWYAYEELKLSSLAGNERHIAINVLNTMWANAFASKELNVLYKVTQSDETHLYFEGYNGVSDGKGGYCLMRESQLPVHLLREGCHLKMESPTRFNVFTGTVDVMQNCAPNSTPKHAIPIENAQFDLAMTEDCSALIEGKVLSATIPERALDEVCVCTAISSVATQCGGIDPTYIATKDQFCDGCGPKYYRMRWMMSMASASDLAIDCDAENGEKGICMTASFKARRITETPRFCDE